jgi:putative oxidoreductase
VPVILLHVAQLLTSGFLVVGLWTPIAGAVQTLLGGAAIYASGLENSYVMISILGLSLAMLGPGAWSIDSHLYGRRRIQLDDFDD